MNELRVLDGRGIDGHLVGAGEKKIAHVFNGANAAANGERHEATFGGARSVDFRWIKGEDALSAYTANNGSTRKFCKHCGSSLIFEASDADGSLLEIALGTLDTPIPYKPDAHIFVANKANWHTICDDLPQFEAGRHNHD